MATFRYTSLNKNGQTVSGTIVAPDIHSARQEISKLELLPQKIKKTGQFSRADFSDEELFHFNQELLALLKSGLKLHDALQILLSHGEHSGISSYYADILHEIESGKSFSQACLKHQDKFEQVYIQAIHIGEQTGDLYQSLVNYQAYLGRKIALAKKVKKALIYPGFLLSILAIILLVLFTFVVPRFVDLYADFSADLPLLTTLLIAAVDNWSVILFSLFSLVVGLSLLIGRMKNTEQGRLKLGQWQLQIPIYGKLAAIQVHARIARILSTLLDSGAKVPDAIENTLHSMSNEVYRQRLHGVQQMVLAGQSLSAAFSKTTLLPAKSIRMVEVGEKTGALSEMLANVAEIYEVDAENQVDIVISFIEPIFMLFVGLLIGLILVAIYLPILSIVEYI